ncbi:MAG: TIGR02301 family protein [Hyphomicrobiaceae bacterium]
MPKRAACLAGAFPLPRRRGPAAGLGLALALALAAPALAQDTKPYDKELMRLIEILGSLHYLRELCGANDGLRWREKMQELMQADGASALRRRKLAETFNRGYHSYSRTYNSCTPTALGTISRFLAEGAQLADTLVRTVP